MIVSNMISMHVECTSKIKCLSASFMLLNMLKLKLWILELHSPELTGLTWNLWPSRCLLFILRAVQYSSHCCYFNRTFLVCVRISVCGICLFIILNHSENSCIFLFFYKVARSIICSIECDAIIQAILLVVLNTSNEWEKYVVNFANNLPFFYFNLHLAKIP